jgi:hypothetical protein
VPLLYCITLDLLIRALYAILEFLRNFLRRNFLAKTLTCTVLGTGLPLVQYLPVYFLYKYIVSGTSRSAVAGDRGDRGNIPPVGGYLYV